MRSVPELDALELLVAVAEHGSISAGAKRTGVSQQAASTRIRGVERILGVEVLRRTPTGVTITPAGEAVLVWAERVVAAAEQLRAGVELLRDEAQQQLTVAASLTVAAHLLPAWLLALRAGQQAAGRTPTRVHLRTENSATVADLVRSGAADLGFIESPLTPSDLSTTVVAHDPLVLVVAPGHPWAGRTRVDLAEVAATPLVSRETGSGTRDTWEAAVRQRLGTDPVAPAFELDTAPAIRSAVGRGERATVISALAVADDVLLGRLVTVPIAGEPIERPITALWRGAARDLAPVSRELIEAATRPPV